MKNIVNSIALVCLPLLLSAQAQQANLLGQWNDPSIIGSGAYNNAYNEVWSVAVNGHEYAIVGTTKGTHFIDVTNPAQTFEADFIPGKDQGAGIIHRDYKTYKNYIYGVCDEGNSSLQIMDFSTLPDSVRLVSNSDAIIKRAHNIFIDTATAKMFVLVFGGSNQYGYGGMAVLDISNPEQPVYRKKYGNIGAFDFGHIHDAYVRNDTAYLNAGNDGFAIVDFKNELQPVLLGTMTDYPGQGYNHSGWLSSDGRYYFLADETHDSPLKTLDVQNFEDIKLVHSFDIGAIPGQIPHNQMIVCNRLYVSYYYDGLRVFDISDPLNVPEVLYYDTSTEPLNYSYKGAWGVNPWLPSGNILIVDMQNGLFVFEGIDNDCDLPVSKMDDILKQKLSFQVRPQPANDKLTIQWSDEQGTMDASLVLFDANLKAVLTEHLVSQNFEMTIPTQLPNGIYFLRLQTKSGIEMKKVLIQH